MGGVGGVGVFWVFGDIQVSFSKILRLNDKKISNHKKMIQKIKKIKAQKQK